MEALIEQRLAGDEPDIEAVAAAHPRRADEIRARYADLRRIEELWRRTATLGAAPADSAAFLSAGAKLDDFQVIREIGRGGMGVVYLAHQASLDRTVALKVVPPVSLSPTTRQRFLREAKALAAMSHPNIVPVHAAGECEAGLYIAMEYVAGVPLSEAIAAVLGRPADQAASDVWDSVLAGESPPRPRDQVAGRAAAPADRRLDERYVRTCLETVREVAAALGAAHEAGIVHRDVKPGNIIIEPPGRARLLDFGLAAIHAEPHVTISGEFFGTPYYVSPEQAQGQHRRIDRATDIYSLGATLYECVTLSPPFEARSLAEILRMVIDAEPKAPRRLNPNLARDLETIILKSLSKDAAQRYASMADFAEDIDRYLTGRPVLARPVGLATRMAKRVRRNRLTAALIALIVLMSALAVVPYLLPRPRPAPPAPPSPVPGGERSLTLRLATPVIGTVVCGGVRYRTGLSKYLKGEHLILRGLSPAGPITLRFHPDQELAPGVRVRARADMQTSTGAAVPAGTPGTVAGVFPGSPGILRGPFWSFWGSSRDPARCAIRWDGIVTPPQDRFTRLLLEPADLPADHETITLHPGRRRKVICCYYPRSVPAKAQARAWPRDGPVILLATLTAMEHLVIRAGRDLTAARTVHASLRPGADGIGRVTWDWAFDLCGLKVATKGQHHETHGLATRLSVTLPFGPGGKPSTLTVLEGSLLEGAATRTYDYATPLHRWLTEHGVRVDVRRETSPAGGEEKPSWVVALEAGGVVVYLERQVLQQSGAQSAPATQAAPPTATTKPSTAPALPGAADSAPA